jgi:hypothetical protein
MATNAELIALFGDDFESVLAGLSKLPPEARELLDQAMGKMLYDADVFSSRVNKAVQTQAAAGMSANAIKAGLLNDMQTGGPVFGEIRNSVKGSLVEGINQSSRAGQFQALDPESDTLFTWVTIAGHKVCLDCAPRGGQQKTLKEWEQEGLPGTGWSVCKGYCYCIIDPSGKISPRLQMEGVVEKGATVKKKKVATAISVTSTALDKKFTSANKEGNQHFVDAFTDSSEKFKKVLAQFPELRHISQRGSGYFSEFRTKDFEKYYKGKKDISYQTRHGGIRIKRQSKNTSGYLTEYGTIRHEYGHFMHHNIHKDIGKMNHVYKKYYNDLKNGIVVSVDDFAKLNNLDKMSSDQLKFHVAYFKDRHRIGVGSKYKRSNNVMKESFDENRNMMHELKNMIFGFRVRKPEFFKGNHALIKALKKDKNDTHGYIQDLFGALTHNKIGYGHSNSYYKHATMDRHEVFANLTALYSHQNPIYWNWVKEKLPNLCKYYEELIDTIANDGYFGTAMN